MKQVGVHEANTHLARLLAEVERGETIAIMRNGQPVARPVPVSEGGNRVVAEAIAVIRERRKGHRLDGITIRDLIEQGRRY